MKLVERVLLLRDFRAQTLRLRGLLYDVLGPAGCDALLIAYEGRMSGDVRLELLALALSPHASPDQLGLPPDACGHRSAMAEDGRRRTDFSITAFVSCRGSAFFKDMCTNLPSLTFSRC